MDEMQNHFFLSTLCPPTAVTHSVVSQMTQTHKILVVSKFNILEFYQINTEGLLFLVSKRYPSKIEVLLKYKPVKDEDEYIIVVTASVQIDVIKLTTNLHVVSSGFLSDPFGRLSFYGMKAVVSPNGQYLLLHIYEQLIKFVKLPQRPSDKIFATNSKISINRIIDFSFCTIADQETVVFLHENSRDTRHVNTYIIDDHQNFVKSTFSQPNVGSSTRLVLGLPNGVNGVLVISDETACYFTGTGDHVLVNVGKNRITTTTFLNKDMVILTDSNTGCHLLKLKVCVENSVSEILYSVLPSTESVAQTVSVIGGDIIFFGSSSGKSYLMRVSGEIFETWENCGPITDLKKIENKENYVINCNGGGQECLGVIFKGSGVKELGSTSLEHVRKIHVSTNGRKEVIYTSGETQRVFEASYTKSGVQIKERETFDLDEVYGSGQILEDFYVVTKCGVFVRKEEKYTPIYTSRTHQLTHCKLTKTAIYFIEESVVYRMDKNREIFKLCGLTEQATCIDVDQKIVVGLWSCDVLILSLTGCIEKTLKMRDISRSVLQLANKLYVAFDEKLEVYEFSGLPGVIPEQVENTETLSFPSSQSTKLKLVHDVIFVISDQGYTLQSSGLVPLAVEDMTDISETHIGTNGVIISTTRGLVIGELEPLTRLSVKKKSSGEQNGRIGVSGLHGILVGKKVQLFNLIDGASYPSEFLLLSCDEEICMCVETISEHLYVIGTAIIKENEVEPTVGRLLVAEEVDGKLVLKCTHEFEGAVYAIKKFKQHVLALINRHLHVMDITNESVLPRNIIELNMIGVCMEVLGDYIIVGDFMKSVTVFVCKSDDLSQTEKAWTDIAVSWVNAVGCIENGDSNKFVSCDVDGNVKIFVKGGEERWYIEDLLKCVGKIHVCECINFVEKSLYKGVTLGGVSGALYNISCLSDNDYQILKKAQDMLVKDNWRQFVGTKTKEVMTNFIDGDKIETILDWPLERQTSFCKKIGVDRSTFVGCIKKIFSDIFQ
ncbi:DNA repair protein xp-E, putative [Entamoeba invadens IP1]|uniref:DNA repair protein xp-E, putative n=1 Tax=Entamoeba invadens IP1 TaxID=370355 RepID=UPI0002C3D2AF|nr:DNA repair protein xp-E, putative [Entamoeba invadens IP1]ELP93813.1 DNA repair protein xp-E, putative [Entamoeba invadens IP1]|eukprot:XP_004260584.1 DNA repair protein xp-E, putative [Entamoeba invadens IP1]